MRSDLQLFVGQLTNRSRLDETERQALLDLPTQLLRVRANRDFVRLGETVDQVSLVVQGVVARFGQDAEGHRQYTALHIAGDAPDLHLVVVPRDTVPLQALSDTTILRVPHVAVRAIAARYPAVAEAFWRHCSVDAAIAARWVVMGRRDARTRVSHLLCEMAVRYNVHEGQGEIKFPFPLTQSQLAEATGMTPVHMNRTLKALAAEGMVTHSQQRVSIPDWQKLVTRADFDAQYLQAGLQPGERLRMLDS